MRACRYNENNNKKYIFASVYFDFFNKNGWRHWAF